MQPDADAIVYGIVRPDLLAGRTLYMTSGPTYDSVRAYGLWLLGHSLLVTITGIATGNSRIGWELPWEQQTTQPWRDTVIEAALRARHQHRHGSRSKPPIVHQPSRWRDSVGITDSTLTTMVEVAA